MRIFQILWLAGLYLSLQYLSLSDAIVLTFLVPICLLFTGAIFLGESFSLRQVFAGRK
jgi:drug/metabolite transporter (DMT)-like permease